MTKKWMAIGLSLVMMFTMVPGVFAESTTFSDMPDDWSTAALKNAVDNGLLNGADGKIMPKDNLTRAQMATIINRAFGAEEVAVLADFDDVVASDWFFLEMAKAVAMETFQGSGNKLNPNDPITREQAFAVIARALNLGESTVTPAGFTDLSEVSTWAKGEVYSLVNNGYIQGAHGKLSPQGYITRAEFAQVMDNIIKEYVNEAGEYTLNVEGNAMINTPEVVLSNSTITGDLIIGDGVGKGEVVLDNVDITGRLLVRGGGTDSIIIKGDSVIGSITIAKINGSIRVYSEDGNEIGQVVVDGKDDVIVEGRFDDIIVLANDTIVMARNASLNTATVEGSGSKLVVEKDSTIKNLVLKGTKADVEVSGKVEQVTVEKLAEKAKINVDKDGEVKEVVANSPGTLIEGKGKVIEVKANANNVVVGTVGTKVAAAEGTEGVMAGDKEVEEGKTTEVKEEATPDSGSSYTAPRLTRATLNNIVASIDGTSITVEFNKIGVEYPNKMAAKFNKPVKVKSVTSNGTSSVNVSLITDKVLDSKVFEKFESELTLESTQTITADHFARYGNVFTVVVTDGTRDVTYTITVNY